MNNEKDFIVLISFIASGIIIASGLAVFLQRLEVLFVTIFAVIMFSLILLQSKEKIVHITKNLENIMLITTLLIMTIGFIVLYKPNVI
jgi:preprotein translocase subunit SecG